MKKLLLVTLFVLGTFAANAQQWYIGPQLSFNLSSLSGCDFQSKSVKPGYAFGVFGGYEINKLIGIEGQLIYSSQGVKGKYTEIDDIETSCTIRNSYIKLPVLAKFNIYRGIYAYIGPEFGFMVGSKYLANGDHHSMKDNFRTFDIGLLVGAGYQFDFGLRAGISYNLGLTNVSKVEDLNTKNRVFAVSLGWRF